MEGERWQNASRVCQMPFDLNSVLQSSTWPEAEDQNQTVQMLKTWVFSKMNYQLFHGQNVGYTEMRTTVIKINR